MRKAISIPNPTDYDISPKYGFIPDPAPVVEVNAMYAEVPGATDL